MNAQNLISILDMTKRRGADPAIGTVEEVTTYAPELEKILGRPIPGTSYTAKIRPRVTSGGAFRRGNQGAATGASIYDERKFNCFFFDSQLQVDEAIAESAEQEGDSLAMLQADEAAGVMRDKSILLGQQIYAGHQIDANGFPGLIDYFDTYSGIIDPRTNAALDLAVDAGGSGGSCEIAWFIKMDLQGVHFLYGGNKGIDMKPWVWQYINDPTEPSKRLRASLSNLSGLIGLSCAHPFSVGIVKNIDNTISGGNYAHPLTDKLIAQLEAKFPVGWSPNIVFTSRQTRAGLQQSRTVTLFGQLSEATKTASGAAANIAPVPTSTGSGIPIQVTDSILTGASF